MLKDLKILYAEDDDVTRKNIKELLEILCNNVFVAQDGQEALKLYYEIKPDIIISDIEMPYLNGLDLATKVREYDKKTQIIITTAYTDTNYFLKAIELNLVKYLVKPVILPDIKEALSIAVQNLSLVKKDRYDLDDGFYYDISQRTLHKEQDGIIHLTNNEMLLLELLLKNVNHTVTYVQIEDNLYDYGYSDISSESLRSLVKNLRKKLPEDTIKNISKLGYRIEIYN